MLVAFLSSSPSPCPYVSSSKQDQSLTFSRHNQSPWDRQSVEPLVRHGHAAHPSINAASLWAGPLSKSRPSRSEPHQVLTIATLVYNLRLALASLRFVGGTLGRAVRDFDLCHKTVQKSPRFTSPEEHKATSPGPIEAFASRVPVILHLCMKYLCLVLFRSSN